MTALRQDLGVGRDDGRRGDRVGDSVGVSSVPTGLIPADVPLAFRNRVTIPQANAIKKSGECEKFG